MAWLPYGTRYGHLITRDGTPVAEAEYDGEHGSAVWVTPLAGGPPVLYPSPAAALAALAAAT